MSSNGIMPQTAADNSSPPSAAAGATPIAMGEGSGAPAAGSGSPAAECGALPNEPSLTVAEAARELSIPERTLRAWIAEGRVEAFRPDPTRRGMRIRHSALEAARQLALLNGSLPPPAATGSGVPQSAAVVEVLQAKLDGAQAAARLHAQRRREEYLRLQAELERREAERNTLETEMSFLRERLVQAEEAERELRILMAQSVQAQQQTARELQALREERERPALAPPTRVRWWLPWKR